VSVPKGSIWQGLRGDCLDAIPRGCRALSTTPASLSAWQTRGYYTVAAVNSKRFELVAASDDFGSALLTDVEHLLDCAAEHQVTIWKHVNQCEWLSPAWLGVTVYYWSYFLVMAITRLTGRTAWFLTKDYVRDLRKLGPTTTIAPGAGCFRLVCGPTASLTDRAIVLEKSDKRVHEEIWRLWFTGCRERLSAISTAASDPLESRLFTAMVRSAKNLGDDWPSAFRTLINYRTGFGYSAVRKVTTLKPLSYLKQPRTYDEAGIIDRFENSVVAANRPEALTERPQVILELLVDLCILLHSLSRELHNELLDRHSLDSRWRGARNRFVGLHRIPNEKDNWPL
jgi:hypothetical protein